MSSEGYRLFVFNPVIRGMELMGSWPSENLAVEESKAILRHHGMRSGDLIGPTGSVDIILGLVERPSEAESTGGYGCILNAGVYFEFREIARKHKINSIVDLGVGEGNVLKAAKAAFGKDIKLCGVEMSGDLLAEARKVEPSADLMIADILQWKPEINDFDLVYMYEPCKDPRLKSNLLQHLKSWMRPEQKFYYRRDETAQQVPSWLTCLGGHLFTVTNCSAAALYRNF